MSGVAIMTIYLFILNILKILERGKLHSNTKVRGYTLQQNIQLSSYMRVRCYNEHLFNLLTLRTKVLSAATACSLVAIFLWRRFMHTKILGLIPRSCIPTTKKYYLRSIEEKRQRRRAKVLIYNLLHTCANIYFRQADGKVTSKSYDSYLYHDQFHEYLAWPQMHKYSSLSWFLLRLNLIFLIK